MRIRVMDQNGWMDGWMDDRRSFFFFFGVAGICQPGWVQEDGVFVCE